MRRIAAGSTPPRFTVLLPVHRSPAMLPHAIESVLAQSLTAFELFVICDGSPEQTIGCARTFAARDSRVKVFSFTKGAGVGEAHRHTALAEARGRYVAHIADDDLWFPNHLAEMEKLLEKVDFGHVIHVYANCDGSLEVLPSDLASHKLRQRILNENEPFNTLGDTVTGYRLEAYRRLPEGWAPPPDPTSPDIKMWRKFLCRDDFTFGTRMAVTALVFASETRHHMSTEDRAREVRQWYARILDPAERDEIVDEAWRWMMLHFLDIEEHCVARLGVIQTLQAHIRALEGLLDNRLESGCPIDFSSRGKSLLYTVSGWGQQEADRRWTDGKEAIIRVRLESSPAGTAHDLRLIRLRAMAFGGSQRVVVLVNGKAAAELTVDGLWRNYDIDVDLPGSTGRAETDVAFQLPDAHSPKSVGVNDDARELGIAVSSMTFLPSPGSSA